MGSHHARPRRARRLRRNAGQGAADAAETGQSARKALREADRLRDRDELDDDEAARLDALEEEIAALSERTFVWSDRQKARGGAIIGIEQDGKLGVMRGLIRPEDMKAKNQPTTKARLSAVALAKADVSHPPWRTTSPRTAPPRCA